VNGTETARSVQCSTVTVRKCWPLIILAITAHLTAQKQNPQKTKELSGVGTFVRWEKGQYTKWARVYLDTKNGQIACDDGFPGDLHALSKGDLVQYDLGYAEGNTTPACQIRKPDSSLAACKKLPAKQMSDCVENWREAGNSP
jgi:hypothetical protein